MSQIPSSSLGSELGQAARTGLVAGLWAGAGVAGAVIGGSRILGSASDSLSILSGLIAGAVGLLLVATLLVASGALLLVPAGQKVSRLSRALRLLALSVSLAAAAAMAMGAGILVAWSSEWFWGLLGGDPSSLALVLLASISVIAIIAVTGSRERLEKLESLPRGPLYRMALYVGGLLLLYSALIGSSTGAPLGAALEVLPLLRRAARQADTASLAMLTLVLAVATAAMGAVPGLALGLALRLAGGGRRRLEVRWRRLVVASGTGAALAAALAAAALARPGGPEKPSGLLWLAGAGAVGLPAAFALLAWLPRRIRALRWPIMAGLLLGLVATARQELPPGERQSPDLYVAGLVPAPASSSRVWMLGCGGVGWNAARPLARRGRLPVLERLTAAGQTASLHSPPEVLPHEAWTTMATGLAPERHGVRGYQHRLVPETGLVLDRFPEFLDLYRPFDLFPTVPVGAVSRRVPALWDIASAGGLISMVSGAWATWPADPIRGVMISDRFAYSRYNLNRSGVDGGAGQVSPPDFASELMPLIVRPGEVGAAVLARFVMPGPAFKAEWRPFDPIQELRLAYASAETYRRVGLHMLDRGLPVDCLWTCFQAADIASRFFWRWFEPEAFGGAVDPAELARFGDTIARVYAYQDEILGEFAARSGSETTLLVASDHGYGPARPGAGHPNLSGSPSGPAIWVAVGPGIEPGSRRPDCSIYDVAPTILGLLGLPRAADMPGQQLAGERRGSYLIPSYGEFGADRSRAQSASLLDEDVRASLQALGYLD